MCCCCAALCDPGHNEALPLLEFDFGTGKMLLDEKEADAEAHEGEKEALWRRIQVSKPASRVRVSVFGR